MTKTETVSSAPSLSPNSKDDNKKPTVAKKKHTAKASSSTNTNTTKKPKLGNNGRWMVRFEECKAYRDTFGHCKVTRSNKENKSLAIWVEEQRRSYKNLKMANNNKKRSHMTQERIELLDSIGFHWGWKADPFKTDDTDAAWEANFDKLVDYHKTHGDFDIPIDHASQLADLGKWTRAQRHQQYLKKSKMKSFLTKDRAKKLDGIKFDWSGPRKL